MIRWISLSNLLVFISMGRDNRFEESNSLISSVLIESTSLESSSMVCLDGLDRSSEQCCYSSISEGSTLLIMF